ncbi:dephospho-CoA kinase domain-containing protein [Anabrus simplex]|uniref:dephospho-CoA kinase domain-containing protein n=1 Tax=Anabrus simplex TaxID=316456 RepID=UPI0035A33F0F
MFIVGLTGGIATGKSTVAEIFREHGIPVIDADVIARKVVEPGRKAWHKIKKEFGEGVFDKNGHLNREALGEIIFENVEMRKKLNEITHPEIKKEMYWSVVKCFFKGHPFIVMDLPLLFESGSMIEYIYKIIVVTCEEDLQLQRLMDRNSMPESRAKKRISAQMPLESKCEKAHFVVENSGTVEDTREQVLRILSILRTYRVHWKIRAIAGICCTGILSLLIWLGTKYWFSSQPAITRR